MDSYLYAGPSFVPCARGVRLDITVYDDKFVAIAPLA